RLARSFLAEEVSNRRVHGVQPTGHAGTRISSLDHRRFLVFFLQRADRGGGPNCGSFVWDWGKPNLGALDKQQRLALLILHLLRGLILWLRDNAIGARPTPFFSFPLFSTETRRDARLAEVSSIHEVASSDYTLAAEWYSCRNSRSHPEGASE